MNNLVKKEDKESWNKIREDTKDHYITKLLHTAEKGAVALTEAYKHSAELEIKTADVGKQRNRAFFFHSTEILESSQDVACSTNTLTQKYP